MMYSSKRSWLIFLNFIDWIYYKFFSKSAASLCPWSAALLSHFLALPANFSLKKVVNK